MRENVFLTCQHGHNTNSGFISTNWDSPALIDEVDSESLRETGDK